MENQNTNSTSPVQPNSPNDPPLPQQPTSPSPSISPQQSTTPNDVAPQSTAPLVNNLQDPVAENVADLSTAPLQTQTAPTDSSVPAVDNLPQNQPIPQNPPISDAQTPNQSIPQNSPASDAQAPNQSTPQNSPAPVPTPVPVLNSTAPNQTPQTSAVVDKTKWSTELGGVLKAAQIIALIGGIASVAYAPFYIFSAISVGILGGVAGSIYGSVAGYGTTALFMINIWGQLAVFLAQMVISAIVCFKTSATIKKKSPQILDTLLKFLFIALSLSLGSIVLDVLYNWTPNASNIFSLVWGILSPLIYFAVSSGLVVAYFARSERAELWFSQNLVHNSKYWGIIKSLPEFIWKPRTGQTAPEAPAKPNIKSFAIKVGTIYGIVLAVALGLGLILRYTVYASYTSYESPYRTSPDYTDNTSSVYDDSYLSSGSSYEDSSDNYDYENPTAFFKADGDFTKDVEIGKRYLKVDKETIRLSEDIYFSVSIDTTLSAYKSMDLPSFYIEYNSTKYKKLKKLSSAQPSSVILYDTYDRFIDSNEYSSYAYLKNNEEYYGEMTEESAGKITYYITSGKGSSSGAGFFIKLKSGAVLDVSFYSLSSGEEDALDIIKLWAEQFDV